MKILRLALAAIFLVAAAFLIRGLLLPAAWAVAESIRIAVPADEAYTELNRLQNWERWAVWFQHDPEMSRHYDGPQAGEGSSVTWRGNRSVGSGTIRIDSASPPSLIAYSQDMNDGAFVATGRIELLAVGDATDVTWNMAGAFGADPFARYHRKMLERSVGATLSACLDNLKVFLETGAAATPIAESTP